MVTDCKSAAKVRRDLAVNAETVGAPLETSDEINI
jgi:hypothetical protein